jgi:4-phytase/acid phosphatase
MIRFSAVIVAFCGVLILAVPAAASPTLTLERVVLVQRHGVRPPIPDNASLARYSDQAWPAWPVAPGELTPHGEATVKLMGDTLAQTYRAAGLLPATGCPTAGTVSVWADGGDQRTRRSGEVLAAALAPGCPVVAAWAPSAAPDPIFLGMANTPACRSDPNAERAAMISAVGPGGLDTPATMAAAKRMQAILAPRGCAGGPGICLAGGDQLTSGPTGVRIEGPMTSLISLSEDIYLEYAEGMPSAQVGWGRVNSGKAIAGLMAPHERLFGLFRHDRYASARAAAPMARLILTALAGETRDPAPQFGPATRLLAFAGHDSNLAFIGGVFGLDWTLPGNPDATAPATTLAFELWSDKGSGRQYVRPVIYYETLEQLRALSPTSAWRMPLKFAGCAQGPMGSCALADVRRRALSVIPADCGVL